MSETLPRNWVEATLGDIVNYSGAKKVEPSSIRDEDWVLGLEDIEKDTSKLLKRVLFSDIKSKSTKTKFSKSDVLYGKLRPNLNKIIIADRDGYCTTEILPFSPTPAIISKFLFYNLKRPEFLDYVKHIVHGIQMPRLGTAAGKNAPIVLAPFSEQKRIVEKLDPLLAKVDACKTRLDKVPEIIKRFRQSVLADAVTGKLTEDWREVSREKLIWLRYKLSDVVKTIQIGPFGSLLHKSDYVEDKIPVINPINIKNGKILPSKTVTISSKKKGELERYVLQEGDIIVGRRGEMGRCAVVKKENSGWICGTGSLFIRPGDHILSKFFQIVISSPQTIKYLEASSVGSTMTNLNQKIFSIMEIELPGIEEQKEIIRRVVTLSNTADSLEKKNAAAMLRMDKLTGSILLKAFRGELVLQDPNDEPAEILIKRIWNERETLAANKKKGGRTSKKRSNRGKKSKLQKADSGVEPEPEAGVQVKGLANEVKDKAVKPKNNAANKIEKRFDKTDVLKAFRKAVFHQNQIDEYTLLQLVGQRLGVQRLSKPIRQVLESCITTAIRRKIIARNGDGFNPATPTIHHYDEDYLIKAIKSLIRKGYEYQRGHVVENLTVYLGYDKVSDAFAQRMKTIFRLAIRRGELYRNGAYVGKF